MDVDIDRNAIEASTRALTAQFHPRARAPRLLVARSAGLSPGFLYLTAALDLLGGLGILLPSLTRIRPQLAPLGALGCVALMTGAIVFHVQRGEAANTPFNFLMAALAGFVAWGRFRGAPIEARA